MIRRKPDWRVVSALGTVHAKQGDYAEAIPYYEQALAISPEQSSVLNNLALAYAANGQPQKAEEVMRRAAENGDGKVKQNLALVLGLQGKHEEAQQVAGAHLNTETAKLDSDYLRRMVKSPQPADAAGCSRSRDGTAGGEGPSQTSVDGTSQARGDGSKAGHVEQGRASQDEVQGRRRFPAQRRRQFSRSTGRPVEHLGRPRSVSGAKTFRIISA